MINQGCIIHPWINQNAEINKTTVNGILSYKCSISKNDIKRNKTTKYQQSMKYFLINVGYHPLRVECIKSTFSRKISFFFKTSTSSKNDLTTLFSKKVIKHVQWQEQLIFLINCNDTLKFVHYFISPYGDSAMLTSQHTVSRNNCQSLKTALIDTAM